MTEWNADKERKALAKGHALQDPKNPNNIVLPIEDHSDVADAVATAHFVKNIPQAKVHEHVVKQAKRLGALHLVPKEWGGEKKSRYRASEASRLYAADGVESRSTTGTFKLSGGGGDKAVVEGCAIRYSPTVSKIRDHLGSFEEEVLPGATNGADLSDIRLLVNHEGVPLSRSCPAKGIHTLELDNRTDGLYFQGQLDLRSSAANDLAVALDTRSIDQCSYGFTMENGQQRWNGDYSHRTIQRYGSITDLSIVTYPAEPTTSADIARSLARDLHFVRTCAQEHRSGRKISKANMAKLHTAVGHLNAAGVNLGAAQDHIAQLLSINSMDDGAVGGNLTGNNAWNNSGGMGGDGTGSRATKKWINKQLDKAADRRAREIIEQVKRERQMDADRLQRALSER